MKSPFPGWEQGTIFKMRDDPWRLQAFQGGVPMPEQKDELSLSPP